MKYTVGRAARRDIDSIAAFYAGERHDLGARFIEDVYRSLQLLQEYPRLGRRVGENYRRFPLHGFPFFINYRIDDTNDLVCVIAVSDQRRRPGYWVGRVEEPGPIYHINWCQTPINTPCASSMR
jgi:plasmid stabilization system protein ParE